MRKKGYVTVFLGAEVDMGSLRPRHLFHQHVVIAERCVVLIETRVDVPEDEMVPMWKE